MSGEPTHNDGTTAAGENIPPPVAVEGRAACPLCGAYLELVRAEDGGCIEETVWTKGGLRRKVRPATYHACPACEYCTEQR